MSSVARADSFAPMECTKKFALSPCATEILAPNGCMYPEALHTTYDPCIPTSSIATADSFARMERTWKFCSLALCDRLFAHNTICIPILTRFHKSKSNHKPHTLKLFFSGPIR